MRARGLDSHGDGTFAGKARSFVGSTGRLGRRAARGPGALPLPQSDPIPPDTPRCPSVGAPLVKTSAVVKREPPSRAQPQTSPVILDIELTVTLPTNPIQVTFAQNHLTVYGGVLLAWIWIAVTAVHLYRRADDPSGAPSA